MAIRTYKVTLDSKNTIAPEPVYLRQGDKTGAVVIDATLMDNGSPVSLSGLTPSFMANTADGKAVVSDMTGFTIVDASGGEFTYQVPSQLGSVPGKINIAYFSFSDSSGAQSTFNVVFVVEKAADITQESAKDWASNLNNIINQYNQWVNDAHSSWDEFVSANKQIIESIDPGGTLLTEVINARKPSGANAYPTLGDRLDAGVDARSKNVKAFGVKGDGSTDDLAAINSMIANAADGDTFFFPSGNYALSNSIVISKKINLAGVKPIYDSGDLVKGTVFRGGGIYFQTGSSGSKASGIGIVTGPNVANGFDIHGTISSITIDRCITIARDHGYLIESYLGLVQNVKVLNCEAHDGIHGFISKATRTTFYNCLAQGLSYWGFGVISDNIRGKDSIGAAIDNKVINCRAIKDGIAFSQYRRNYFEDNGTNIPCTGNLFLGCSNQDCSLGLSIGDSVGDTGGGKYTTYPVSNTVVSSYIESGGPLQANYSENLTLSGLNLQSAAQIDSDATHQNIGIVVSGRSGQKAGSYDDFQTLDSGSSPSLKFGYLFKTNNSSQTNISSFSGGQNGEIYTIVLWDSNTTISPSTSVYLMNGQLSGYGSSIILKYQDGVYFELFRSKHFNVAVQQHGPTALLDPGLSNLIDFVVDNGVTPNPITISNPSSHDALLRIFIRSSGATFKQGGFSSDQFVVPDDLPSSDISFGTGLMTTWAYFNSLGKYVLVNWRMTKYA